MNEIEKRIHRGMNQMAPDVFQNIMADTGPKLESEVWLMEEEHKHTRNFWMRAAQTAAVLAACCMLILGIAVYQFSIKVDSVVEIDVNPSLELQVSRSDRVVRVHALNADGVKILEDLKEELNHSRLEEAVQILVDTMVNDGYLDQEKNSVLVSVEHGDAEKSAELQLLVADNVKEALGQDQITPVVYHQSYTMDSWITDMSQKYEISPGKAAFIQKLLVKRPDFSMEKLARMSISEITELLQKEEVDVVEYTARNKKKNISRESHIADGAEVHRLMAKAERLSQERAESTRIKGKDDRKEELSIPTASISKPEEEEQQSPDGVIVEDEVTGGFQTGTNTDGTDQTKPGGSSDSGEPDQNVEPDGEISGGSENAEPEFPEEEEQPDQDVEEDNPDDSGQLGGSDHEGQETDIWEDVEGIPTILHTQIQNLRERTDCLTKMISRYQELAKELGEKEVFAICAEQLEQGKTAFDQVLQMSENMYASGEIKEMSYQKILGLMKRAKERLQFAEQCLISYMPKEEPEVKICPDGE